MITALRIFMLEWALSVIDKRIAFRDGNPSSFDDHTEMRNRRQDIIGRIVALKS